MFQSLIQYLKERSARGQTMRSARYDLLSITGFMGHCPAQASLYSDCKGRFFSEPIEYQLACVLAVAQVGE